MTTPSCEASEIAELRMRAMSPDVLRNMRWRVEAVDAALAKRAKHEPGTDEYATENLSVCRIIGDAHWIAAEWWRELISAAESVPRLLATIEELQKRNAQLSQTLDEIQPFDFPCDRCGRHLHTSRTGWLATVDPMVSGRAGHFCNNECWSEYGWPKRGALSEGEVEK